VLFNGLTTMAGFGSLLIAHHRGVWSLGVLLVIGSATTLIAALVVLPTLARRTGEHPAEWNDAGSIREPFTSTTFEVRQMTNDHAGRSRPDAPAPPGSRPASSP